MFSSTNQVISIHSYDGQIVWEDKKHAMFEIGNFLGGGWVINITVSLVFQLMFFWMY